MNDKRRHPRFRDTVMITYESLAGDGEADRGRGLNELPCWLKEMSEGGAMLQAPKPIASGTRLLLHVMLPTDDADEMLEIRGEARWEKACAAKGPWYVGVQFDALPERQLAVLRRYIELRFSSPTSMLDTDSSLFD